MNAVELRTTRLLQSIPVQYLREHGVEYVHTWVENGWASGTTCTLAIRYGPDREGG